METTACIMVIAVLLVMGDQSSTTELGSITLQETNRGLRPGFRSNLLAVCREIINVADYGTNNMAIIHNDGRVQSFNTERGAGIRGITCDQEGRLYVFVRKSTFKCELRLYEKPGDSTYTRQSVKSVFCESSGILIRDSRLYLAGVYNLWVKDWELSTDPTQIVNPGTSNKLIRLPGNTGSSTGQFTASSDGHMFVGRYSDRSITMYSATGTVIDTLLLGGVLTQVGITGKINGPFITAVEPGHLLVSVGKISQYSKGFILHVSYTPSGFITPPRVVLQVNDSRPHQLFATDDGRLIVNHYDGNSEVRVYKINK